jgi:hypothetical protein
MHTQQVVLQGDMRTKVKTAGAGNNESSRDCLNSYHGEAVQTTISSPGSMPSLQESGMHSHSREAGCTRLWCIQGMISAILTAVGVNKTRTKGPLQWGFSS